MKQSTGNKLFVKALKEEGVEVLFGYPGATTIDISDELYKQNNIDIVLPRMSRLWSMKQTLTQGLREK